VDNILESITDQANDACGEFAENYLGYVNAKEKSKLEDMLSKALQTWLDETGNQPSFFTIENSEAIKVE
jgi:hypothetical protein